MSNINFLTPIYYQEGGVKYKVFNAIESYCSFGGRKAYVIPGKVVNGSEEVVVSNTQGDQKNRALLIAFKVATYITGIIPFIMFVAKTLFRATHKFHIGVTDERSINDAFCRVIDQAKTLKSEIKYTKPEETSDRFSDVKCPLDSAIRVNVGGKERLFHANLVKMPSGNEYIATQAPITNAGAFRTTAEEFWIAAFERSSPIIDLTSEAISNSCYYPKEIGGSSRFGDVTVTLKSKDVEGDLEGSVYEVLYKNETKTIKRFQYRGWVDKESLDLEVFKKLVIRMDSEVGKAVPMIHCRAGVGRTGTFITALELYRKFQSKEFYHKDLLSQVEEHVMLGRKQRNPDLYVQSLGQFRLVVNFIKSFEN